MDKQVTIQFLGRPRVIEFTMPAIKDIKENTGIDILQLDPESRKKSLFDGLDHDKLTYLVWSGFKHEDPELTLEQVEASITPRFISSYVFKFLEVCGAGDEDDLRKNAEMAIAKAKGL